MEFYVFCLVIMGYVDMRPQPHDEMLQFIASLFPDLTFKTKGQHFGLILVPRNCFKSVIFSVALPLYLLWKNPNSRGLLSAHRHDASKQYLRAVKWHIENNQKYIALCGSLKPKFKETKWAEDAIIVLTREIGQVDPSVDTCGVDRSKVGAHPDWVIADDLHSDKNVNSALMRQKVYGHIQDFYPMLQPGGTMIIVGTRWHNADAYGRLIQEDLDAINEGAEPQYQTLIRSAYEIINNKKILYFPERLSEAFLETAQRRFKGKFTLWYMNQAIADTDKLFPKDHLCSPRLDCFFDQDTGFQTIRRRDTGEEVPVSTGLAWDPAGIEPTDKSDFHGFALMACDINESIYIPKAEAFKGKPDAVVARAIQYLINYSPDFVVVEDVVQSGLWGYLLRKECERVGVHCPPILLHKPSTQAEKFTRITTRLQPKWEAREVIIDPSCRELIDQFDQYPQLDFDDIIDAVHIGAEYVHPPDTGEFVQADENLIIMPKMKDQPPDPRIKLGSFAGACGTQWGSGDLTEDAILKR